MAQADLEEIFEHIPKELSNPAAAKKLIDEFDEAFNNLSFFPMSHPLINNEYVKDKTLRKVNVKKYIAFFQIIDNEVQAVRVLYGMSNYESIL